MLLTGNNTSPKWRTTMPNWQNSSPKWRKYITKMVGTHRPNGGNTNWPLHALLYSAEFHHSAQPRLLELSKHRTSKYNTFAIHKHIYIWSSYKRHVIQESQANICQKLKVTLSINFPIDITKLYPQVLPHQHQNLVIHKKIVVKYSYY